MSLPIDDHFERLEKFFRKEDYITKGTRPSVALSRLKYCLTIDIFSTISKPVTNQRRERQFDNDLIDACKTRETMM
jgi:hypothetical protein